MIDNNISPVLNIILNLELLNLELLNFMNKGFLSLQSALAVRYSFVVKICYKGSIKKIMELFHTFVLLPNPPYFWQKYGIFFLF